MQVRVEVRSMTSDQLASFRRAVTASMGISDDRGYSRWAGIHGLPLPISCQHHNLLFLPWHRAYLYLFEKSLQDQVAGVTLPWWDWTSAASHTQGIPDSYTDTSADNPLQSATVAISASDIEQLRTDQPAAVSDSDNPVTVRDPMSPTRCRKPRRSTRSWRRPPSRTSPLAWRMSTTPFTSGWAGRCRSSRSPRSTRYSGRTMR